MNTAFTQKLENFGIDFGRFLVQVVAALAAHNNPRYDPLIEQAGSILDAHIASLAPSAPVSTGSDVLAQSPGSSNHIANAEPDGGFPGSPKPGSAEGARNGHHEDTHDDPETIVNVAQAQVAQVPAAAQNIAAAHAGENI